MHSLPARNAYEEVSKRTDYGYESLLLRKLRSILRDCERRIDANQRRVEENEREKVRANPHDEEISELSTEYDRLLENGELDEANAVQTRIAELKAKRAAAATAATSQEYAPDGSIVVGQVIASLGSHPQYQNLRVCDICGLLLSSKEASKLDDHYIGKLHTGFVLIREKAKELETIVSIDNGTYVPPKPETTPTNGDTESTKINIVETPTATSSSPASQSDPHLNGQSTTGNGEAEVAVEAEKTVSQISTETKATNGDQSMDTTPKVELPLPKPRSRAATGYETELPDPPRKGDNDRYQRDRERPRYGDERDREYERDRDANRYSGKDRYRRNNSNDRSRGYEGGRHYRDRDGPREYRDRDYHESHSYRRDSYRERY